MLNISNYRDIRQRLAGARGSGLKIGGLLVLMVLSSTAHPPVPTKNGIRPVNLEVSASAC